MSRFFAMLRGVAVCSSSAIALASTARADTMLLNETFASDPVAAGRATVDGNPADASRFTYSAANHAETASANTLDPTTRLVWSLGKTLNQNTSFSYSATFSIASQGFYADPNGYAELTFGLINSATTGFDRTGSPSNYSSDNTFDMVTTDYFPNVSSRYGGPSLTPDVFQSQSANPGSDAFAGLQSNYGQESALDDPGESPLPQDVALTADLTYDAATRMITLRMLDNGTPLDINKVGAGGAIGGADGNITTIQLALPSDVQFSVNSFAVPLWRDGFANSSTGASLTANLSFSHVQVAETPEPASLLMIAIGSLALIVRRHHRLGA